MLLIVLDTSSVRAKASLNGRSQVQIVVFFGSVLALVPSFVIKATEKSLATNYKKQGKQKKTKKINIKKRDVIKW